MACIGDKKVGPKHFKCGASTNNEVRLCSGWSRSPAAGVLPLTATKQSSGLVTREVMNVGCMGYCEHRAPSTRMARRDRTLPYHLDWRYRPKEGI